VPKPLIGYCAPLSCRPGEAVRFMVHGAAGTRYDVDIVRLICGDSLPGGAGFEEHVVAPGIARALSARPQHTSIGSFAVNDRSDLATGLRSFTLAAVVRPTSPGPDSQAIAGCWDPASGAGFTLGLDPNGSLCLRLGDRRGATLTLATEPRLTLDRWSFVAAAVDVDVGRAKIWHRPLGAALEAPFRQAGRAEARLGFQPAALPGAKFVIAADGTSDGRTSSHFNGCIEGVRLLTRALDEADSDALLESAIPESLSGAARVWFDFSVGMDSPLLHDRSPSQAHARIVNLPTRAVPGHRWTGEQHDWRSCPQQYAAVHFHADDLYDAGWDVAFTWTPPADLPSGVYAARLTSTAGNEHVPFFVLPAATGAAAPVAFLAATATYLAYANARVLLDRDPPFGVRTDNEAAHVEHPEFGLSTYDRHRDGSGVQYSSPHRPILNLKPNAYRWSFCADMNVVAWLNRAGHAHDVITDDALHREGVALLKRHSVIVTGTHPEYWSTAMLDALEAYLQDGGRLMYLGGNGFYWRIAYSDAWPGAIEVRRAEGGTRPWIAETGAYRHAFTGEMGGLWRRLGRPPNRLAGVGFSGQGFPASTFYLRTEAARDPRAAFIFEGVDEGRIGDFGSNGGGAAGEEIDRYDPHLGSPAHALVVATSAQVPHNVLRTIEEVTTTNSLFRAGKLRADPEVRADMVYFECPNGGAVFSTGSIAWAGALAHNGYRNAVAKISDNVLRDFTRR
jgi:N,N-dimethylformamidase